jgi:hypothetical protein
MSKTVISVDPGETTGIAYWTDSGQFLHRETLTQDELYDKLEQLSDVAAIVCEDYRLRQGKQMAQTGSRFVAVQIIGALKAYARRVKAKFILQSPQVLTVAALHSQVKRPSNHAKSHDIDAYNHGFYYFETQGLLKPQGL